MRNQFNLKTFCSLRVSVSLLLRSPDIRKNLTCHKKPVWPQLWSEKMDAEANGFQHHEFGEIQCNGSLKRQKKWLSVTQSLLNCLLASVPGFKCCSVPYTGVTEGGCALILTTKCHCSLIVAEQSKDGVFGESSVGQLGKYYTIIGWGGCIVTSRSQFCCITVSLTLFFLK